MEALVAVTRSVEKGEPLARAQLLASIFYEELRRELRRCPDAERAILITAVAECGRAAIASTAPAELLRELASAVATLSDNPRVITGQRPVLRVIQGGLT
jgi:hypothetical protein